MAAAYAKERVQFGRPIAMFQAVKHHCANMAVATELATCAVWDAAKAAVHRWRPAHLRRGGRRHPGRAGGRPVRQPQHPGARRHRHHLGARRPPLHAPGHDAARACCDADEAAADLVDLTRRGVIRGASTSSCRPRPSRSATRCGPSPSRIKDLPADEQRDAA